MLDDDRISRLRFFKVNIGDRPEPQQDPSLSKGDHGDTTVGTIYGWATFKPPRRPAETRPTLVARGAKISSREIPLVGEILEGWEE